MRSVLYGSATIILSKPIKGWATRIARRAGPRKAKVARARKLAVILHRMLADSQRGIR